MYSTGNRKHVVGGGVVVPQRCEHIEKQETKHIGTYVYVSIDRQAIESSILISTFEDDDDEDGEEEEEKNQAF